MSDRQSVSELGNTYECIIDIKKASIFGGGLPHDSYVETVIDGEIFDTTVPKNPPEWNKTITKSFPAILNGSVIILFAVYKKRWTAPGYKLVGTVEFTLDDLINDIRKAKTNDDNSICGEIAKDFSIKANKRNITLSGSLSLRLELKQHFFLKEKVGKNPVKDQNEVIEGQSGLPKRTDGRRNFVELCGPTNIDLKGIGHPKFRSQKLKQNRSFDTLSALDGDSEKERNDFDDTESCRNSEDSNYRPRSLSYQEV